MTEPIQTLIKEIEERIAIRPFKEKIKELEKQIEILECCIDREDNYYTALQHQIFRKKGELKILEMALSMNIKYRDESIEFIRGRRQQIRDDLKELLKNLKRIRANNILIYKKILKKYIRIDRLKKQLEELKK